MSICNMYETHRNGTEYLLTVRRLHWRRKGLPGWGGKDSWNREENPEFSEYADRPRSIFLGFGIAGCFKVYWNNKTSTAFNGILC